MAIQLIINKEWGLAKNENPNQGSVHHRGADRSGRGGGAEEFERSAERGGVLGAMETGYQRGKIQDESLYYEHKKHDGSLPDHRRQHLPRNPRTLGQQDRAGALHRGGEAEPAQAPARVPGPQRRQSAGMLERLQQAAIDNDNVFAVLMDAVRYCSLGQITEALFEVGGQYRRRNSGVKPRNWKNASAARSKATW
jgi:isobutyryl-CoA mutase